MKLYNKLSTLCTFLMVVILTISLGVLTPASSLAAGKPPTATPSGPTPTPGGPTATPVPGGNTITVTSATAGLTEQNIGSIEACARYETTSMTGLGIKNFRFYAGMQRLEPEDDDGVYGSPSIAQIKANPNLIPWSAWDAQFNRTDSYHWTGTCLSKGTVPFRDMLNQLTAAGIAPVFTLRMVGTGDKPVWARELNPPNSPEDLNEWWEHVFATVYYVNVLHNWQVNDWEVHNEPDNGGQGWDGTIDDYQELVRQTDDAIAYVYATYLPGQTYRLHAPGATSGNEWVRYTLEQNDSLVDVVNWHKYGDPVLDAQTVNGWIDQYNADGLHDPQYLGEWGSYRGGYDNLARSLEFMEQLRSHSLPASHIESSAIFSLFDWTNGVIGLVDINGTPRETYYAMRLMIRGLQGGKQAYATTSNLPAASLVTQIAAKDQATGTLYVEIINQSSSAQSVTLDVSAHATTGTVTFRQYSGTVKDAVTGAGTLVNGKVTFNLPKQSIVQVIK
jgi:hypothetical protein